MNLQGRIVQRVFTWLGFLILPFVYSQAANYPDSLFHHKFVNYSVGDGLPSSVVYGVLQDSLGFMWFATESGVSRFNGYQFENFTLEDGLPDNDIIEVRATADGRIWFLSFSGIGYCYPGLKPEFHILKEFDGYSFREVLYHKGQYIFQVERDNKEQFIFYDPKTQQNKIKEVFRLTTLLISKGSIWREYTSEFKKVNPGEPDELILKNGDYPVSITSKISPHEYLFAGENELRVFNGYEIIPLKGKYAPKIEEGNLHCLFVDRTKTIWLSSKGKGLYCQPLNCDLPPRSFPEFQGTRFSDIYQDDEGNYWLTSLTDGIFFLSKYYSYQQNYAPEGKSIQKRIQVVANLGDQQIALGTANAEVLFLDSMGIGKVKWGDPLSHERIRGVTKLAKDTVLAYGERGLGVIATKGKKELVSLVNVGIKDVCISKKNRFWMGTYNVICGLSLQELKRKLNAKTFVWADHELFRQRAVAILEDEFAPYLLVGNPAGLRIWKTKEGKLLGEPKQILNGSTLDISQSPAGDIWISTDGKGVVVIQKGYSPTQFVYKHFSVESKTLPSNTCKRVIFGDSNEVWVATNRGLSVIKNFSWEKSPNEHETDHLNTAHGLLSNNINDFAILDNALYVGTDKGLTVFDLEGIKRRDKCNPEVVISEVRILEKDTTVLNSYELDYHHRNIKIGFVSFAYASQGNIQYQYKMEPLEKNWITTSQTFAHYPSLDPGEYTFRVKAFDNDGMGSNNPTQISLVVSPIWWNTGWFRFCAIVLVLALFGGAFYLRVRMIKKQEQLKTEHHREIADYQRQTLSSQMNPHFIFNALVAVQNFILKSDGRSANKYVAKFSKLIRNVLEGSQHKTIPLSEEIRTLELYLELELLRFGDRFQYEITVDPELFPGSIQIPPMILQPFVENAIRHGLKPLKVKGHLLLSFEMEQEFLKCTVEDNGIGRKKAVEFRSPHHTEYQSRGMELTLKRIELLNSQQGKQSKVEVEDLTDAQGNGKGTRVIVYFPLH